VPNICIEDNQLVLHFGVDSYSHSFESTSNFCLLVICNYPVITRFSSDPSNPVCCCHSCISSKIYSQFPKDGHSASDDYGNDSDFSCDKTNDKEEASGSLHHSIVCCISSKYSATTLWFLT
jgi:hypothetical protein